MQSTLLCIIFLWISASTFGQVANYTFQQQTDPFVPLSNGQTILPDPVTSPTIPIGFNFQYNGLTYDSVHVAENGWLWFGPKSSFLGQPHPIGGSAFNGPVQGIICAFGNELIPQLFDPGAKVWYATNGTAPNRILTVEWKAFTRIQPVADGEADILNFQIQFVEGSNQIRMNYNCLAAAWSSSGSPGDISSHIQVGLRGNGVEDFHIRTGPWGSTSKAGLITPKILFTDSDANQPVNLSFIWSPGIGLRTIITGNIPSGSVCTSTPYGLNFSTTGSFPAGNQYVAQLSGSNGIFSANPPIVGQGTSSPIQIQLPGTAIGNGYRLRVVSLNPVVVGSVSQPFVSQNCCNTTIQPFGPHNLCPGDSLLLTAGEGLNYQWLPGGETTRSIWIKSGGQYTVRVQKTETCIATASISVSQVVVNPLLITANTTSLTAGQSAVLTANGGNTYNWAPPTGLSSTNGQTVIATPNQTTTYTASSLLPSGCTARGSITISVETAGGQVAPVTIFPGTGTYDGPQAVGMSSTTPGAVIYYTTNGNIPLIGSSFTKIYSGPFMVLQSTTIRAMAVKTGMQNSAVRLSILTISKPGIAAKPVISPGGGVFSGSVEVSISTATQGAQIWYTTNGNLPRFDVPNSFTRRYTGPFTIYQTTTIRAIALKDGFEMSPVGRADITVNDGLKVAPIAFQPQPGQYSANQQVSLTTATPDAQIWYTTNGNVPLLDRPNFFTRLYAGPLAISQSTQIRAIAVKPGFQNSVQAIGNYTITNQLSLNSESGTELYPNPGSGKFRVHLAEKEASEPVTVTVVDAKGKVWLSKTFAPVEGEPDIELKSAGKGLYFVKCVQGLSRKTLHLIVE